MKSAGLRAPARRYVGSKMSWPPRPEVAGWQAAMRSCKSPSSEGSWRGRERVFPAPLAPHRMRMGLVERVCSWTLRSVRGVRSPEGVRLGFRLMGSRPAQVKVALRLSFWRASSKPARQSCSVGAVADVGAEAAAMVKGGCADYGFGRVESRSIESCSVKSCSAKCRSDVHPKHISMLPIVSIYTSRTYKPPKHSVTISQSEWY